MGNLHLVTGYAGHAHISAADHGSLFAAAIRGGQFVLNSLDCFSASAITSNTIRVQSGELVLHGRHVKLDPGFYVDLTIENGAQGYFRTDLIVARYTKDANTGVEDCNLVVIKGTPVTSNPSDPACTTAADINVPGVLQHDMPLYRVHLSGLTVGTLEPLFTPQKSVFESVAPAGYGLGGIPSVAADLNTKADTGWWVIDDSTQNKPNDIDLGVVQVMRRSSSQAVQIAVSITGMKAQRVTVNYPNTWDEWEYENPNLIPGTEYRTTKRHNGSPVYEKLIRVTWTTNIGSADGINGYTVAYNLPSIDTVVELTAIMQFSGTAYQLPYIDANGRIILVSCSPTQNAVFLNVANIILTKPSLDVLLRYTKSG